jgi:hypothetical protein
MPLCQNAYGIRRARFGGLIRYERLQRFSLVFESLDLGGIGGAPLVRLWRNLMAVNRKLEKFRMEDIANQTPPLRREKGPAKSFVGGLLVGMSCLSGLMLATAIPNLVSGDGITVIVKTALLACGATLVGYGVNRLAVERGAPLANRGYPSAAILSVTSILAVGAGLFSATYSGMTYSDVERLRLEAHAEDLTDYVAGADTWAAQAASASSAVRSIAGDLRGKVDCEVAASCLSGRGNGGRGPVARALEGVAGKAEAIAAQIDVGAGQSKLMAGDLYNLLSEFQNVLADPALSPKERRQKLSGIDVQIKGTVGNLSASMPLALLGSYAKELTQGISIEGRPETQAAVSNLLNGHGAGLASAVSELPEYGAKAPAFPAKTGVSDTFAYMAHFAPIAAIAAVTELILPLSLWLYSYLALNWAIYLAERPVARTQHPHDAAMSRLLPGPEHYAPAPSPANTKTPQEQPVPTANTVKTTRKPVRRPKVQPINTDQPQS